VPKLEEDWRWEALGTLKERRAAFDEFCKATAAEQRRMKEERQKGVERAFATLLHEAEVLERQLLLHRLCEQPCLALPSLPFRFLCTLPLPILISLPLLPMTLNLPLIMLILLLLLL
jgi:hypothetical protein